MYTEKRRTQKKEDRHSNPTRSPPLNMPLHQIQYADSQNIIQRMVKFCSVEDDLTICEMVLSRPAIHTPAKCNGNHTTAMDVFIKTAQYCCLGYTYEEALYNLSKWVESFSTLPGINEKQFSEKDYQPFLSALVDAISITDHTPENVANWGAFLENCALEAVKLRNKVPLTFHVGLEGHSSGAGEAKAMMGILDDFFSPDSKKEMNHNHILALLDYRNCKIDQNLSPTANLPALIRYQMMWEQHKISLDYLRPLGGNDKRYEDAIKSAYCTFSRAVAGVDDLNKLLGPLITQI